MKHDLVPLIITVIDWMENADVKVAMMEEHVTNARMDILISLYAKVEIFRYSKY